MTYARFFACLAPLVCHLGLAQPSEPRKAPAPQAQQLPFPIAAGRLYEHLGEWEKAEEEYLKARESLAPTVQREALDAIDRVRKALREQRRHDAVRVARSLEKQERWKEAEQAYLDLLKSDPAAENEVAEGLMRLRPRLREKPWAETFDQVVGVVGRALLLITFVLVVWTASREIRKTRRSIQFLPFRASSDSGPKQVSFWLGRVRAELRTPAAPATFSPSLAFSSPRFSPLPFFQMPDLLEQINEPTEFEVGGVKLPLKWLMQLVSVPRVRVSCAWMVGSVTGVAFAEIERRQRTEFEPHSVVARSITSSPGAVQDRDLRLFAFDVFIKAGSAYER